MAVDFTKDRCDDCLGNIVAVDAKHPKNPLVRMLDGAVYCIPCHAARFKEPKRTPLL